MPDLELRRWERRTRLPLVISAFVFLGAYALPILKTDVSVLVHELCRFTTYVLWAVFAVDVAVRFRLADSKRAFLRSNWIDVVAVTLPAFRTFAGLPFLTALNVIGRRGRAFVRGRIVAYVGGVVGLMAVVASLAVLDAERTSPEGNIRTLEDALWWAAETVTTVGYGDHFPTTSEGRIVAVGLMVTGIALLGVVTAALASWFVELLAVQSQVIEERTEEDVLELLSEVRALRVEVAELLAQGRSREV